MKIGPLVWLGTVALVSGLTACGVEQPPQTSSSVASSATSTASSSSKPATTTSKYVIQNTGGYTALSNGKGGVNYQPTVVDFEGFDRDASQTAFEGTLYKFLRSSGCSGCHSNTGAGQAPLHSDGDVELAHEYALTKVNFKKPAESRFVERMKYDRHNCPGSSCADAATKMLDAVEDWIAAIDHMIPETPEVPTGSNVSEADIKSWIAADKNSIAAGDQKYMVYTSLHELHNEGLTAHDLNTVRSAVSKALNSTARWAPKIVNPVDINDKGLVYRFDIRDYWGYNQGIKELFFGGSDDDLAFGNGKRDYKGNTVNSSVQQKRYNFSGNVTMDPDHAILVWERVLHGNVEGAVQSGTIPPYINGFHGVKRTNAAGEYNDINGLEWVEAAQLVYTLTRPDVYNAIMMNPFYADQMERHLGVDISKGMDSYEYIMNWDAITVDSRLLWRAKRKDGGFYWKSWDVFTGQLASGRDRSIFDVYADADGKDIRFPFWANPIPKFVDPAAVQDDRAGTFSFIASLAQTGGFAGFSSANTPGCDNQPGAVQGFGFCRHYSGAGGGQQSASEIIYDLPNGLQAYYLTGGFNQRRVDAFTNIVRDPRVLRGAADNIASATGYSYTNSGAGGFSRAADPRLNVGSSCIGCHLHGMNRLNNDLRDWLDNSPSRLPKGQYGVDGWVNNPSTVARVRQLYKPNDEWKETIEGDRKVFLEAMGEVNEGMSWGEDKNIYVEPIIWTVEYVQYQKYKYRQTTSN